jgi:hypothetical protein
MIGNAREDRPWERPGGVRRDCVSHRGPLLVVVSSAALFLGLLSFAIFLVSLTVWPLPLRVALFAVPWSAGQALAGTGYALARRDLALMAAGLMDPAGRPDTVHARNMALGACVWCCTALFIGAALLSLLLPL